jgi:hypothetical protein
MGPYDKDSGSLAPRPLSLFLLCENLQKLRDIVYVLEVLLANFQNNTNVFRLGREVREILWWELHDNLGRECRVSVLDLMDIEAGETITILISHFELPGTNGFLSRV